MAGNLFHNLGQYGSALQIKHISVRSTHVMKRNVKEEKKATARFIAYVSDTVGVDGGDDDIVTSGRVIGDSNRQLVARRKMP